MAQEAIGKKEKLVAKTLDGKKIVSVPPHARKKPGGKYKTVKVPGHRRSTPQRSKS